MSKHDRKEPVWAPPKHNENQLVITQNTPFGHHQQKEMFSLAENELNGVEMGVLNDGTPYLTQRGMAALCGTPHSVIGRLAANWDRQRNDPKGRAKEINQILLSQGINIGPSLYIPTSGKSGDIQAYPDYVCMAILEYYAFTVGHDKAKYNHRILARQSLKHIIYAACKYNPQQNDSIAWENLKERLILNERLPRGYYSIFKEIADFSLRMIVEGLPHDPENILDISVGSRWGTKWRNENLDSVYGNRILFPHIYPGWYPQSKAGAIPSWVYPIASLPLFREWLEDIYIKKDLPSYLDGKIRRGVMLPANRENIIRALTR